MTETEQLLRNYADSGSENAFREFVDRYIDLVYSTALRKLAGDTHLAEDVTQAVFTDLARKVRAGESIQMPGGWLHHHTCFLASKVARTESRRRAHETQAAQMNSQDSEPNWQELAPILDDAMSALEPLDRHAIVLRFFEKRDFHSVGHALGISDDAAQKRVSRAVDKLRTLLASRGVALSATLLATLLAEKAVHAAPIGLASKVVLSVATSVPVAGVLTSILGKLMTAKMSLLVGTVALITAISIPLAYKAHHAAVPVASEAVKQTTGPTIPIAVPKPPAPAAPADATVAPAEKVLHLTVLDAATDKPLRNVEIMNGNQVEAATDAKGECDVAIRLRGNEFRVSTVKELFADAFLLWIPEQGDAVPSNYTIRLTRATPIGGHVLDSDGRPIAGATVGFGALNLSTARESFSSSSIRATTDQNGHWEINRFAGEVLSSLGGAAMHPNYGRSASVAASDREALEQLKELKYVFRLAKSGTVRGRVIDLTGTPIPGAEVLVGFLSEVNSRKTNASFDGTFIVQGCKLGTNLLTANAEGYTATTTNIQCTAESGPYDVVLKRGSVLKMRVVDSDGNPIANAQISFNHFMFATQMSFLTYTDQDGRAVWNSAPEGNLSFGVSAPGFMSSSDIRCRADGEEHVVTLAPGLVITGTVIDASSRKPIPSFRLILGTLGGVFGSDAMVPDWFPRNQKSFKNGQFRHTLAGPVVLGETNFMFKIEADGHKPFISRLVNYNEGEVRFDVELQPAQEKMIHVFGPDGQAADYADIGLVSPGKIPNLVSGGFKLDEGETLLHADQNGWFRFSFDDTATNLMIAHPSGYLEATPAELQSKEVLTLHPWGRLEVNFGSIKLVSRMPFLDELNASMNSNAQISFDNYVPGQRPFMCFVNPDEQGTINLTQLPAGQFRISWKPEGGRSQSRKFEIRPGETTTLDLTQPPASAPPSGQ